MLKNQKLTKTFFFSKNVLSKELPKYVLDYVFENETLLTGYKTKRDFGIFTTKKIILFDNTRTFGVTKEVIAIPYNTVSTVSVIFKIDGAELLLIMNNGYQLYLKFIDMVSVDKLRLRLLYSCISRVISNQEIPSSEIKRLNENDVSFKD